MDGRARSVGTGCYRSVFTLILLIRGLLTGGL